MINIIIRLRILRFDPILFMQKFCVFFTYEVAMNENKMVL